MRSPMVMVTRRPKGPSAAGGNQVFERDKMLVGDPGARALYFSSGRWAGGLPSDLDGPPPAPGTPNVFAFPDADEWGGADSLVLFDFSVDWANAANSTFTQRTESPLAVASFDPTTPIPRNNVPQPAPGVPTLVEAECRVVESSRLKRSLRCRLRQRPSLS